MLKIDLLKELLLISIVLSTITCALVQKTKIHFKTSKFLPLYSLIVNLIIGIIFCKTFTNISFPTSLWIGSFSYIGADSIYKALEGKIANHTELRNKNKITIPQENIINREDK